MTTMTTHFPAALAPCGQQRDGDRYLSEDQAGLVIEEVVFSCGCRIAREEFHDGSLHRLVTDHRRHVLVDEELRGE